MLLAHLKVSLLFLCFSGFIEANVPRMIFTVKDTATVPLHAPGQYSRILLEAQPDTVTAVGPTGLISFNFQTPVKTPVEKKVLPSKCQEKDCSYNFTLVHRTTEAGQLLLCGAAGDESFCCNVNVSDQTPMCVSSGKAEAIDSSMGSFSIMEGAPSALVESAEKADLYITKSASQNHDGIFKFGKNRVGPVYNDKEQHYLRLMPVSEGGDGTQDKVYAFYKEKNKDPRLDSEMWLPFVTRVCATDLGGPKNNLQFSWTSQMNARLYCGDPDRRHYYSELVDVATVQPERGNETRVYALFRNEWGISAVCVYTVQDMQRIFATSLFKGNTGSSRERRCVRDSRKILLEDVRIIERNSEMEEWVRPERNAAPLLFSQHQYTHICADSSPRPVLFLSLSNGSIHKVTYGTSQSIVIAEYRPFQHSADITSITLSPQSRKLYVTTEKEVVQVDVANCIKYGDTCEDCVLARDPHCGWDGAQCTSDTQSWLQVTSGGDHTTCPPSTRKGVRALDIVLPAKSSYFLNCPVSSHHARYTWHHRNSLRYCHSNTQQCLFLISSMDATHAGTYRCVSEEKGFRKVLAEYNLHMENRAVGPLSSPLIWLCLITLLIRSL